MNNYFRNSHQVLMTIKSSSITTSMLDLPSACLDSHAEYYRMQKCKLQSYGYCINQNAICIILNVDNNEDLEHIISNDPQLISEVFEIDIIIPFRALIKEL